MNVSGWVKAAGKALQKYRPVTCEFCGAETLSGGSVTFCSNCESIVGTESKTMESSNPALSSAIVSIRSAVLKNDFESASAAYDELLMVRQSPQLLYARGLMLTEYSNYTVSQISYDGEGFMERNSELRRKGSLLISEAKRLIAKSLSMSEKDANEAPTAYVFYRMFLCSLKMNDLRAANDTLGRISKLANDDTVAAYARIAFDTYVGRNKEAERGLDRLLKTGNAPANAFYYAAFNAFKLGDHKGAEHILVEAGDLIDGSRKVNLLQSIRQAGLQ
jgi:hypothetical protein